MPKETWIIASVLTVALLMTLLGISSCSKEHELEQLRTELAHAREAAAKGEGAAAKNAAAASELKEKLDESQAAIEELKKQKAAASQAHKSLEQEMRAALESKDVTISQLQGKLTVNILDRVLFDSGEADLKPDGQTVLRKVAAILSQHPNLKIHVIGHTDNVPIRAGAHSRFLSNWELSTGRATAAVRFLSEKAGVDPRRLGAVGYGEFRPVADNSTVEGRARNRRIAITILSEELAGADTTTPAPPGASVPPAGSITTTNTAPAQPAEPTSPPQD
jgi:chemotaxis protein MotB